MKLLRTRITYDWSVMHIELTYHMSEGLKESHYVEFPYPVPTVHPRVIKWKATGELPSWTKVRNR